MSIATKIASGYLILLVLLVSAQLYQSRLIQQMRVVDQQLAEITFESAQIAVRILKDLEEFQSLTQKYIELGDPDYGAPLSGLRGTFDLSIAELAAYDLSPPERDEVRRLQEIWARFRRDFQIVEDASEIGRAVEDDALAQRLEAGFAEMRMQTEVLIQRSGEVVEGEVQKARAMSERVEWISWWTVVVASGLAVLVSFVIVGSISRPLRELTRGVRAVAKGDFSFVLDESGQDEVAELSRNFNVMVRRLNELDELKKDFVSHVSHELKAPLASMQEINEILLEGIPGPLSQKQRWLLELNRRSGVRLSSMIQDLLHLSTIEAGAMPFDLGEHSICEIVDQTVEGLEGLAHEKNIQVQVRHAQQSLRVQCDRERLIQVFTNLLSNAVKFSEAGSAVSVESREASSVPNPLPESAKEALRFGARSYCLVMVSDRGPGIPDEHKELVFQKFHDLHGGKKMVARGTGLGLAITRGIVHAHRGAVWVSDHPAGGSVFHVLLPSAASQNAA